MSILNSLVVPRYYHIIIEFVYMVLIIGTFLAIYFRTKEIEQLTSHKGIMLFRNIFLFFSLAYLVRFIHMIFIFVLGQNGLRADPLLHIVLLIPVSLLSNMALLFLLATVTIKSLNVINDYSKIKIISFIFLTSLILIIPTIIFRSPNIQILIQLALIIGAGIHLLSCKQKNKSKKSGGFFNNKLLFILISFFWVLSLVISEKSLRTFDLRLIAYGVSLVIFALIYFRVHKRLKSK